MVRIDNLAFRGGKQVMDAGYYELSSIYVVGYALAQKRLASHRIGTLRTEERRPHLWTRTEHQETDTDHQICLAIAHIRHRLLSAPPVRYPKDRRLACCAAQRLLTETPLPEVNRPAAEFWQRYLASVGEESSEGYTDVACFLLRRPSVTDAQPSRR